MGDTGTASALRDIVSQVKDGRKDRAAAFNEMRSILSSTTTTPSTAAASLMAVESSINSRAGFDENQPIKDKGMPVRISQEERRQIIQNLLDKKTSTTNSDGIIPFNLSEAEGGGKSRNTLSLQKPIEVDESRYDNRAARTAKAEESIRQEIYKEFTFKPSIKKLPNSFGTLKDRDTPFYIRATKWKKDVSNDIKKKRLEKERSAVDGCTFHPKINKNSELAMQEIHLNDISTSSVSCSERLYSKGIQSNIEKLNSIQDELVRDAENVSKQCTFKPKRITENSAHWSKIKSRYSSSQSTRSDEIGNNDLNCTFTPQIKGVGSHMNSAKLYIDTNVIDRLTRPTTTSQNGMDMTSSFSRNHSFSFDNASFQRGRSQSAPIDRQKVAISSQEQKIRKQNFATFLSRQNKVILRRERNVENLRVSMTPDFKPRLPQAPFSLRKRYDSNFLARCERDLIKRTDSAARLKVNVEYENTFKPQVNLKSRELRSRSVNELSRGDVLKSIANKRIMKIRDEQEEMSELTFKPEITKTAKKLNKSLLKLHENPANALSLHNEIIRKRQKDHEDHLKEKEEKEFQQCSFVPKIINCPDYVRRIAKSMAIVRETRKLETEKKKNVMSVREQWK